MKVKEIEEVLSGLGVNKWIHI